MTFNATFPRRQCGLMFKCTFCHKHTSKNSFAKIPEISACSGSCRCFILYILLPPEKQRKKEPEIIFVPWFDIYKTGHKISSAIVVAQILMKSTMQPKWHGKTTTRTGKSTRWMVYMNTRLHSARNFLLHQKPQRFIYQPLEICAAVCCFIFMFASSFSICRVCVCVCAFYARKPFST